MMATETRDSANWILDSGASSHMSFDRDEFMDIKELKNPISITIANGTSVQAMATGSVPLTLMNGENVTVYNVLYVPDLDRRLLSIPALVSKGIRVTFGEDWCDIGTRECRIARVSMKDKMYILRAVSRIKPEISMIAATSNSNTGKDMDIWHARLGHLPEQKIEELKKCVTGLEIKKLANYMETNNDLCKGCVKGRLSVQNFSKSSTKEPKTNDVLELIHSDIMGPMNKISVGGSRYILNFIDDYSRYVKVYFIKRKSQVFDYFMEYKSMMEGQTGKKVKCIRTDNGKELVNTKFGRECKLSGIIHQTTVHIHRSKMVLPNG